MQHVISAMLVIVGVLHLLPLSGVLGPARLEALYGLSMEEPNLTILMRHRAVLFGLLGGLLLYAAFRPMLQPLAFVAGTISVLSFVILALMEGTYNDALRRVVLADIVALICLAIACLLAWIRYRSSP